jgi:Spy/CpxP family protein refolding chaperone
MRKAISLISASLALPLFASAQPASVAAEDASKSPIFVHMMAFDKNKDGKLTKEEITDPRLVRLFDQADTNKDGTVTKEELLALAAKLDAEIPAVGRGGPRGGGPDGFGGPGGGPDGFGGPGGPGGGGPGGPGGPGGGRMFGRPQPGQVLPPMLQEALNLTDDQKKQVAELQKDVDARLAKILTQDQMNQLKQMRQRGPGGPGGPGGGPGGGFGGGGPGGRGPGGPGDGGRGPGGPGDGGPQR